MPVGLCYVRLSLACDDCGQASENHPMDEKQPRSPKSGRPPEGRDPRFVLRVALMWLAILILVPVLWKLQQFRLERVEEISYGKVE